MAEMYVWEQEVINWFESKFDKLDENSCWIWKGALTKDGYGQVHKLGYSTTASRLAYQIHNNVKITRKELVCHTCDNPACVNPSHLFLGSHLDNMRDMINKGRQGWKPTELLKLTCHSCGTLFTREKTVQSGRKSKRVFCTHKCALEYTSIHLKNKNAAV